MKKLIFILLYILLIITVEATEQIPDIVIYKNQKCYLGTHWTYPSPLEIYFLNKYGASPFTMHSTSNYRGFVATWEVNKDELFLTKINIKNDELDLKIIFNENVKNNKVKADWFSGYLFFMGKPYKTWHDSPYSNDKFYNIDYSVYIFLEIYKGNIINQHIIPLRDKKNKNLQVYESLHEKYEKYIESNKYENNKNRIHSKLNDSEIKKFLNIISVINKINDDRNEEYEKKRKKEKEKYLMQCFEIYSKLEGYNEFIKTFSIEDATLGYINTMPYSVFLELKSKSKCLVDSIWWWNPVTDNKASTSWDELLIYYENASKKLNMHQWIKEWKDSDPSNSIEIHVLGHSIGETEHNYNNFTLLAWNHAQLQGKPQYFFLLRNKDDWFAEIFLNDESDESLITFILENQKLSNNHWLYKYNLSYHPTQETPEYIIVNKNGKWEKNQNKKFK